jgi:hypothetical protein
MLATEDFGVEIAVTFSRDRFSVRLSADFNALLRKKGDVFWDEGVI